MSSIFQRVSSRWVTGSSDKGVDGSDDDTSKNDASNEQGEKQDEDVVENEQKDVGSGGTDAVDGEADDTGSTVVGDDGSKKRKHSISNSTTSRSSLKKRKAQTDYSSDGGAAGSGGVGASLDVAIDPEIRSEYRSDGNVDAEVLKLVGASLEQDKRQRTGRHGAGDDADGDADINDWSGQPEHEWQSFLKPESLRESGPGHDQYIFDNVAKGSAAAAAAVATAGGGRRKKAAAVAAAAAAAVSAASTAANNAASSNVDPALEHLDDTQQNFDLVQEAVRQARSIRAEVDGSEELVTVPNVSDTFDDHENLQSFNKREAPRRQSGTDGSSRRSAWTGDGSERGGTFTNEEIDTLNNFLEEYRKQRNWTPEVLKQRVWTNERQKDNFWDDVATALPHRTRASIYKHIRRSYHVFEVRGRWTPEEDELLSELYQRKGAQWKSIGLDMDRMPEDCRDRWRNYVKCGDKRRSSKWDLKEELILRDVVVQMQRSNPGASTNWTLVSEQIGGTRSRIQCRYKWNKLMKKVEHIGSEMDMLRLSERMALVEKLRSRQFESERQIEWEEIAVSLQEGFRANQAPLDGISAADLFTPRQCQLAYRNLSYMVEEHESKTLQQVLAELSEILYRCFVAMKEES